MKLSPTQERIIATQGNLIVRASAGTGKTLTMVEKIATEITKNQTHKAIAAITFTIKAAQEIRDRLTVDADNHFIGTNNSFVIEEIIKPFMKDFYGKDFAINMSTDYSKRYDSFQAGVENIKENGIIGSYTNNRMNFVFDLAQSIVENSQACRLFLKAKYFKIYIDEYQDCDRAMHKLFMYICENLGIDIFVIGDEKQSIYIWRGAYPDAFMKIWEKENFNKIFMGDNFRSCQQIQNYSNLLCNETRDLFCATDAIDKIVLLSASTSTWADTALENIDKAKKTALLRYRNNDSREGARQLTQAGLEFVFIPQTPIGDITTDAAWLYSALAKYCIIQNYSVYDLISEIPSEGSDDRGTIRLIKTYLVKIHKATEDDEMLVFMKNVNELASYLGCNTNANHLERLYETIHNISYHVAFQPEKYKHIAITFHSSKGLEFDQVIVFAQDYRLADMESIYNHYVAVTRAKSKLIIVDMNNNFDARTFRNNLQKLLLESGLKISDVLNQM